MDQKKNKNRSSILKMFDSNFGYEDRRTSRRVSFSNNLFLQELKPDGTTQLITEPFEPNLNDSTDFEQLDDKKTDDSFETFQIPQTKIDKKRSSKGLNTYLSSMYNLRDKNDYLTVLNTTINRTNPKKKFDTKKRRNSVTLFGVDDMELTKLDNESLSKLESNNNSILSSSDKKKSSRRLSNYLSSLYNLQDKNGHSTALNTSINRTKRKLEDNKGQDLVTLFGDEDMELTKLGDESLSKLESNNNSVLSSSEMSLTFLNEENSFQNNQSGFTYPFKAQEESAIHSPKFAKLIPTPARLSFSSRRYCSKNIWAIRKDKLHSTNKFKNPQSLPKEDDTTTMDRSNLLESSVFGNKNLSINLQKNDQSSVLNLKVDDKTFDKTELLNEDMQLTKTNIDYSTHESMETTSLEQSLKILKGVEKLFENIEKDQNIQTCESDNLLKDDKQINLKNPFENEIALNGQSNKLDASGQILSTIEKDLTVKKSEIDLEINEKISEVKLSNEPKAVLNDQTAEKLDISNPNSPVDNSKNLIDASRMPGNDKSIQELINLMVEHKKKTSIEFESLFINLEKELNKNQENDIDLVSQNLTKLNETNSSESKKSLHNKLQMDGDQSLILDAQVDGKTFNKTELLNEDMHLTKINTDFSTYESMNAEESLKLSNSGNKSIENIERAEIFEDSKGEIESEKNEVKNVEKSLVTESEKVLNNQSTNKLNVPDQNLPMKNNETFKLSAPTIKITNIDKQPDEMSINEMVDVLKMNVTTKIREEVKKPVNKTFDVTTPVTIKIQDNQAINKPKNKTFTIQPAKNLIDDIAGCLNGEKSSSLNDFKMSQSIHEKSSQESSQSNQFTFDLSNQTVPTLSSARKPINRTYNVEQPKKSDENQIHKLISNNETQTLLTNQALQPNLSDETEAMEICEQKEDKENFVQDDNLIQEVIESKVENKENKSTGCESLFDNLSDLEKELNRDTMNDSVLAFQNLTNLDQTDSTMSNKTSFSIDLKRTSSNLSNINLRKNLLEEQVEMANKMMSENSFFTGFYNDVEMQDEDKLKSFFFKHNKDQIRFKSFNGHIGLALELENQYENEYSNIKDIKFMFDFDKPVLKLWPDKFYLFYSNRPEDQNFIEILKIILIKHLDNMKSSLLNKFRTTEFLINIEQEVELMLNRISEFAKDIRITTLEFIKSEFKFKSDHTFDFCVNLFGLSNKRFMVILNINYENVEFTIKPRFNCWYDEKKCYPFDLIKSIVEEFSKEKVLKINKIINKVNFFIRKLKRSYLEQSIRTALKNWDN